MRNITISLLFFIFIVQSFGVTVKFRLYCEDLCSNFYLKNDLIPISGYYQQDKFNTYPTIEAQLDDTIKIEITKSTNNNNTPTRNMISFPLSSIICNKRLGVFSLSD